MLKVVWIYEILGEYYSEDRRILGDLGCVREEGMVPPSLKTPCWNESSARAALSFYFIEESESEVGEFEKVPLCLGLVSCK